jgi:hypothetical protein
MRNSPNISCLLGVLALAATGCSAFDFFGFEENAPLHIVERPDGYPSANFGAELAPTSSAVDGDQIDVIGVAAGEGYPTVFYRLAAGGKLVDVEDPWRDFQLDAKTQAQANGSGASLVGLSRWDGGDGEYRHGCVAIGEPAVAEGHGRVTLVCEDDPTRLVEILSSDSPITDEQLRQRFGHELAAVRPLAGENWLLAVATTRAVVVFSSVAEHSEVVVPTYGSGDFFGEIVELAAGRLANGRIFLAATTVDELEVYRLHLFVQDGPGSTVFNDAACVNRSGAAGFAGEMVAADLDLDGQDELLVSAADVDGRDEVVYVYDVVALAGAGLECSSEDVPLLTAINPGDGPLDIRCEEECDFGVALAVGDIATDDNGPEVLVGAPGAKVDGKGNAGAVFVYRGAEVIEGGEPEVAGRVALSTPGGGQRFGGGVAVAPMAGRNEAIIGLTGAGKLAIAFCTEVGEDIEEGADVTSNASGTVVSTRCRPK